jgi:putative nucleotidyltransferase with HDIG domain
MDDPRRNAMKWAGRAARANPSVRGRVMDDRQVRARSEEASEADGDRPLDGRGAALRVLVVDDDPGVLDMLCDIFAEHGCAVSAAFDTDQALEHLAEHAVDLLVADIRLPGRSGLELLREARALRPGLAVVLTTGLPSVNSTVFALRHGAYDYLLKPVSLKDVRQLLERLAHDRPAAAGEDAAVGTAAARRQRQLGGLFRIGEIALEGIEAAAFMETVLTHVVEAFRSDAVLVLLRDADGDLTRTWKGSQEVVDRLDAAVRCRFDELVGVGGREGLALAGSEPAVAWVAAPVVDRRHAVGVVCLGRRPDGAAFAPDERDLLVRYGQAIALGLKATLLDDRLEGHVIETIGFLVTTLESRDASLRGHSARVALFAGELARVMGLARSEVPVIRRAGALHDLGRLLLKESILLEPGPLTPEQYAVVQRHPTVGARMLRRFGFLAAEAEAVEHHLARYDGTGPGGRRGDEIPLAARVVKVADALDAIMSPRPYRPARPLELALAELSRGAGTEFDPDVVRALLSIPSGRLAEISRHHREGDGDGVGEARLSATAAAAAEADAGSDVAARATAAGRDDDEPAAGLTKSYLVVARGYQDLLSELQAIVGELTSVRVIADRRTDRTLLPRTGREGTSHVDFTLADEDLEAQP